MHRVDVVSPVYHVSDSDYQSHFLSDTYSYTSKSNCQTPLAVTTLFMHTTNPLHFHNRREGPQPFMTSHNAMKKPVNLIHVPNHVDRKHLAESQHLFRFGNRQSWIQSLGTRPAAVENSVASVQAHRVV
jgi:hypothetical protein